MTIRNFTSFDAGVNATLLAADGWYGDLSDGPAPATGRFGRGIALQINSHIGSTRSYNRSLGSLIGPTIFKTFGMKVNQTWGDSASLALIDSRTGTAAASFRFTIYGAIQAYNAAGVLVAQTPSGIWVPNSWFQFEAKIYQHATAGAINVRYNKNPVISVPSTNTLASGSYSAAVDVFQIGTRSSLDGPITFNELIFSDDQGAVNNDWLGTVNVNSQFVTANGHLNQFSIGGSSPAATNWQSVLNTALDDTKYVYDPTVGDVDFYQINPSLNSPAVYAAQVKAAMRQDDATQRVGRVGLRVGSTDYIGSNDFYLDQNYRFYSSMWELNPATSAGWTGSDVNAIQIGVKVNA